MRAGRIAFRLMSRSIHDFAVTGVVGRGSSRRVSATMAPEAAIAADTANIIGNPARPTIWSEIQGPIASDAFASI